MTAANTHEERPFETIVQDGVDAMRELERFVEARGQTLSASDKQRYDAIRASAQNAALELLGRQMFESKADVADRVAAIGVKTTGHEAAYMQFADLVRRIDDSDV